MNKLQENKLSMYILVENTCKNFKKDWNSIKAFADASSQIKSIVNQIQKVRQKQEADTSGSTEKRNQCARDLIKIAVRCSSILKAYAIVSNDVLLKKKIRYSKSELVVSRDTILLDRCKLIYQSAANIVEKLSDFGMTPELLADFDNVIQLYKSLFTITQEAIREKRYATKTISNLFQQGDAILNGPLDHLINLFEESCPEFFEAYTKARKINHLGIRHKSNPYVEQDKAA